MTVVDCLCAVGLTPGIDAKDDPDDFAPIRTLSLGIGQA
jgi:hypothetical protein